MSWLFIPFVVSSVCISGYSTGKVVKIVNEPANYGGLQSYKSNNPRIKQRLKAFRKEVHFSGPYHLQQLLGKCFSLTDNSYKYELCPFSNITQHEQTWRWNAFQGILGIWKEWSIVNNTFQAMVMDDGDECPGNTRRKSKVFFKCGNSNSLVSVKEPSTCTYEVIFKTPLACPVDAFLVYPMLSGEAQKEWEDIEESLYHEELTVQGYHKKRRKLFVRVGLQVSPSELNKKKIIEEAVPEMGRVNKLFVPKTGFNTKQECFQAYSELLHEFVELRRLLVKQNTLSETINKFSEISNVELTTNNSLRERSGLKNTRVNTDQNRIEMLKQVLSHSSSLSPTGTPSGT